MDVILQNSLFCPECHDHLKLENRLTCPENKNYGLLKCSCSTYPLVAGIPMIKKDYGHESHKISRIIEHIKSGDYRNALSLALMQKPSYPDLNHDAVNILPDRLGLKRVKKKIHNYNLGKWQKDAETFFRNINGSTRATDLFDFYFLKSGKKRTDPNDYFTYRFGQPRHLSALSVSRSIRDSDKPVLDLGCGFGHITRGLTQRHNVIGLDNNFFLLFVAKYWIATDAVYVCCEADRKLPFKNDTFCATICVNSFHFFDDKDGCMLEIKRLIDDRGTIILSALHHAKTRTKTPNSALTVSEYADYFNDMSHTILSDEDLVQRYTNKCGPALDRNYNVAEIEKETLISIIACHDETALVDHGQFDHWPHSMGKLQINPLYVHEGVDENGQGKFRRRFPSKFYEEENHLCKTYLPDSVTISPGLLEMASHESGSLQKAEIDDLVANCVLLDIPENYL